MRNRFVRALAGVVALAAGAALFGGVAPPAGAQGAEARGCRSYTGQPFVGAVMLNPDGTPIGCGTTAGQGAPSDLTPSGWETTFSNQFDDATVDYETRLGWACADCAIGIDGDAAGTGLPIGFPVDFYGTTYTEVFVTSNGSISFVAPNGLQRDSLDDLLNDVPGVVAAGYDQDNDDLPALGQWGTGRHTEFFYWGRTTFEGHDAFVATWMGSHTANLPDHWNTFQVALVDIDDGAGNEVDVILNYGSILNGTPVSGNRPPSESGYRCVDGSGDFRCTAHGFGAVDKDIDDGAFTAVLGDDGFVYDGATTAELRDGGSHALRDGHRNSSVPGRYRYAMRNGTVAESATRPLSVPVASAAPMTEGARVSWTLAPDASRSAVHEFFVRYRLAGSQDPWDDIDPNYSPDEIEDLTPGQVYEYQVAAYNGVGLGPWSAVQTFLVGESNLSLVPAERVLDTRPGGVKVPAGGSVTVPVGAAVQAPPGATAALVELIADGADEPGFLTGYACGAPVPLASNVNYVTGLAASNAAVVPLNANGELCVYTHKGVHVIVDVVGWVGADGVSSANPVPPARVVDTRVGLGAARLVGGQEVVLDLTTPDKPSSATGASLTATGVGSTGPGWVAIYDCAAGYQGTSSLDLQAGAAHANMVTVPVDAEGEVCARSMPGMDTDLVVDVTGWWDLTGSSIAPTTPTRVADTREGLGGVRLAAGEDRVIDLAAAIGDFPNGVVVNLTAVNAGEAGFLTAHPCGSPPAATSTVNYLPGEVMPAPALITVPAGVDTLCVYTHKDVDVVADVDAITYVVEETDD